MKNFQVAYLPIGVPTFHLESAQLEFEHSVSALSSLAPGAVAAPDKMLLSLEDLEAFLDTLEPSLIVLQNTTFANSAYASAVLKRFSCPVLLWTLREPVIDGGRLRLNSLTGAYSAANALHEFGRGNFEYVFGAPQEADVLAQLGAVIGAARVLHDLSGLHLAAIGHTPQGFGFGRALDSDLLHTFGVTLEAIEARELIEAAQSYSDQDCLPYLEKTQAATVDFAQTPQKNALAHARLYRAYEEYITQHHIGAIASRCWPDFFTAYGTPVCGVLAMLNDNGIAASCEADVYGALSMYIGLRLTGSPAFFGDPVSLDEGENTITYWHCGTAACSLADCATGAQIGVHPNRKIGPAMDFGCKAHKEVTIFRVGRKPDGTFRLFIAGGEALQKPKQFTGTSVVVKTALPAKALVTSSVKAGWEPHFAVIYGDVAPQLTALGHMLGLEIWSAS